MAPTRYLPFPSRPLSRPRTRLRLWSGLAVSAVLLTACTSGSSGEGAGPDPDGRTADSTGVGDGPAATGDGSGGGDELAFASPDADDFNRLVPSEEGLVDLQPVPILGAEPDGDRHLVVSFEMGSHHCHGVQVTAQETDTEVVLDLRTGRRSGVSPAACAYGVYPYTTGVDLAAPLGERAVTTATDGAAEGAGGTGVGSDDLGSDVPGSDDPGTSAPADADGSVETTPAPVATSGDLATVDPATVPADDLDRYLGRHVEDGVEWALANDREWRILSLDGEPVDAGGPRDPERLSFTVVADVIVAYEWS